MHKLAVERGFLENKGGLRGLRVGIDIRYVQHFHESLAVILTAPFTCSGWFYRASSRHGHTKNPELAALLARCARLLSLPFFPLFVFDGPERPAQKRNKTVRGTQHWLARDTQEMLVCLGIPWIEVGQSSCPPSCSLSHLSAGTWRGGSGAGLDVERGSYRCCFNR